MEDQVKTSFGRKHAEKNLQNFTIPKIKRNVDKFCLVRCSPNRREYGDILDTLNKGRLNLSSDLKSSWTFSEMKLVSNNHLTEKFSEKRNEMKELGRHNRELEERFCFLVVPNSTATDIAQHGLSAGHSTTIELGNPELGVYLFRHIDVALNAAHRKKTDSNVVLIFKVLFGKVKPVHPGSALKSVLDPTPHFDSHISKKAALWTQPLDEQVTNSLIYVYEYDSSFKPAKTPRQCLPIAAVDAKFIVSKTVTSPAPARLPSKPSSSGNSTLANCTVVKRIGKGKDAMVIFKSVRPPVVQSSGIEAAKCNVSDKEAPYVPVLETEQSGGFLERSPLFQNNITLPDLSISLQQHNVPLENPYSSCLVITSKSMKDPRLLRRSDQETINPVGHQNQYSVFFENAMSGYIEQNPSKENSWNLEDGIGKTSAYLSFEERRFRDRYAVAEEPIEKGLKKYSSFFTYFEKEGDLGVESLPFIEEEAENSMRDQFSDQLGTGKSLETEFADSMSISTSHCTNRTSGNGGKSEDDRYMSQDPNLKSNDTLYMSFSGKETEAENEWSPNISCYDKNEPPNDKFYKICASQSEAARRSHVYDYTYLEYSEETNEDQGETSEENRCLNSINRDTARAIYSPLHGKKSLSGIETLPNTFCKENLELPKKFCRDNNLYRTFTSQVGSEKSQQAPSSNLMSLDHADKTSENGGKSENQKVKNKETNVLLSEERVREKSEVPEKPHKDDNLYKTCTSQVGSEKSQQAQSSNVVSLDHAKETSESGGKSQNRKVESKEKVKEKPKPPEKANKNDNLYRTYTSQVGSEKSQQAQSSNVVSFDHAKENSESGGKSQNRKVENKEKVREKPKLPEKPCRNDNLYRACSSQEGSEKSQQASSSNSVSLDPAEETSENGGKSEIDRHISQNQKVKNKETAFLLLKEKVREKQEFPEKPGRNDNLYRTYTSQVGSEKSQHAKSSNLVSLDPAEETSESAGKSRNQKVENKETEFLLLKEKVWQKPKLPEKPCRNYNLYRTYTSQVGSEKSQQGPSSNSVSLDPAEETSEIGGKSQNQKLENKVKVREKLELPEKPCRNDNLYRISLEGSEKSQQSHSLTSTSLDYSKGTSKDRGISEIDRHISQNQKVKDKEAAFKLIKEKVKEIESLPSKSGEEKPELSKTLCRQNTLHNIQSVQVQTEKSQQTQESKSMSLYTSHYNKETVENQKQSEIDQRKSKTQSQNTYPASASLLSYERKKKSKEIESSPNKSSLQTQVLDPPSHKSLNNSKETSKNRAKSEGQCCFSQDTAPKEKATAKTTSSIDFLKEQFLHSKKKHVIDSSSTKLLKKSNERHTGVKRVLFSPDKDRMYKDAPQHSSEKVTQNNDRHKIPAEENIALNEKHTSTDGSPSPQKVVSAAEPHEKMKYQKDKEKLTMKTSPEKKINELYESKDCIKKTEEYKKVTTAKDSPDHFYTPESLSESLDINTTQNKDRFASNASNKLHVETNKVEKTLHPSQLHPVVIIPKKANVPSDDFDELVQDICIETALHAPYFKKVRNQALAFPKNTHEDVSDEDLGFLTELEKRIDWSGIFGMEKVNATLGTLQSRSLRREREPSGLRVFPDMEITIKNNHYVGECVYTDNIVGELQPSMEAKEALSKTFQDCNVPQDPQITDSVPQIQIAGHEVTDSTPEIEIVGHEVTNSTPEIEIVGHQIIDSTPEIPIVGHQIPDSTSGIQIVGHQVTDPTPGIQIVAESPILQDGKYLKDSLDPHSIKVDNDNQLNKTVATRSPLPLKKTSHKLDNSSVKKKQNKKRIPSVLVKTSTQRIRKFSQSEENIKVVLGMLSDEIPLCKNKRISKKLDRAVLHLRKAHKRVQKSLQLVAKAGERRSLSKSGRLRENHSVNGKEQAETPSSQTSKTEDSSPNTKASEVQKSPTADRKCLTESTQVMVNGASVQDSQQAKVNGGSTAKMSLFPPGSQDTPENPSSISSVIVSNKENTLPVVPSPPSPKSPSDVKDKQAADCEAIATLRNKRHTSRRMFSQVRKLSLSVALSKSKCSSTKSRTGHEKGHRKRIKERESKNQRTSSLLLQKLSHILQKASETDSIRALQSCKLKCHKMIPAFIKAFEEKQCCVLRDVIADRRLFMKENLKTCFRCTLKPQAVEAFLELQMIVETNQFVENRMSYIEGRPTFRSLLWYDGSLYTELLMGESGFQQQSHLYSAFQEKLKLNPLSTLENHYTQLSEFLQTLNEKDSCYYVYLKYKRELQECEDVLRHDYDHAAFSLSVPFSCGVYLGDTIDDLTALQQSTVEIIRTFLNLPKCNPGKKEHALSLLEVISAKIDYIKTSASTRMHLSLFGIEHLLFDAAKMMAFNERKKYFGQGRTVTKELISQINDIALSKLYEVYCVRSIDPIKSSSSEILDPQESSKFYGNQDAFLFGKVIDQARCAEPGVLKKMVQDCNQHLQLQSKCFQILQECIVEEVLIQETNVLDMAKRQDKYTILLKPEAVEAYIDLAMTYETLHFLSCLMASRKNQPRTRGLLWYDTSLFSDLVHSQRRLESFLQEKVTLSAIDIIDSTIAEIKSELEVISNCSDSVNYTYAFQIMTRELSELSELKNFMKSKPSLATYIHFSPFVASLHYGNSLPELDHNYLQFSDYLGSLMSTPKKDLGKLAHTMKIMKTIELAKYLVLKPGISRFDVMICSVRGNRTKHEQALKRQNQEGELIPKSQSPRKRMCTNMFSEDSSFSPKKQKVLRSPEKALMEEKEGNEVTSGVRDKKESKFLVLTNATHGKESGRISAKDGKASAPDKCHIAAVMDDRYELTAIPRDRPPGDRKRTDTRFPESFSYTGSECDNGRRLSDTERKKARDEISEEKESSVDDNMSFSSSSMDMNASEEAETTKQLNAVKQEEVKGDPTPGGAPKGEPATWNGASTSTAGGRYAQFPASAHPWQYSLYCWYQNSNNTGAGTQGYPHVSYNTQMTNPYSQSPAFPVPNSYMSSHPYARFSGQMYPVAAPFGANVPYSYTDPSSSTNPNPVPIPYSYSSAANTGWPWGSWQ